MKADQRVVVGAFPLVFPIGHLLNVDLECREMGVEYFKFRMLGIKKAIMHFPFDHHI